MLTSSRLTAEQVFCLPIPEKAKRQWNFIIIPKGNDGLSTAPEGTTPPEQIVWTFQEPTKKELEGGAETGPEFMAERLNGFLTPFGKKVVFPTKEEFQSTIPQSHLKGEPGFHVKAFRGSKEGKSENHLAYVLQCERRKCDLELTTTRLLIPYKRWYRFWLQEAAGLLLFW